MTAAEQRDWMETPAGQFQRQCGMTPPVVDHDQADRLVEETRTRYRRVYGRELDADELGLVRRQAELRSRGAAGGHAPSNSHELARLHGWGVIVDPRDTGVAMRDRSGQWTPGSDPKVIAGVEDAEAALAARRAQDGVAWGPPVILQTVAGPS